MVLAVGLGNSWIAVDSVLIVGMNLFGLAALIELLRLRLRCHWGKVSDGNYLRGYCLELMTDWLHFLQRLVMH